MDSRDRDQYETLARGYFYGRQDSVTWLRSGNEPAWLTFAASKLRDDSTPFHQHVGNIQTYWDEFLATHTIYGRPEFTCVNPWHQTSDARARTICPECKPS